METVEGAVFLSLPGRAVINIFQVAFHRHHVPHRHQSSLHMIALPSQMESGSCCDPNRSFAGLLCGN